MSPDPLFDFFYMAGPGPEVIKLFSYSTQLSTKFILLINVKMPTIVGILTFISMINTAAWRLKARNFFICRYFSFNEQLKFIRSKVSTSCLIQCRRVVLRFVAELSHKRVAELFCRRVVSIPSWGRF